MFVVVVVEGYCCCLSRWLIVWSFLLLIFSSFLRTLILGVIVFDVLALGELFLLFVFDCMCLFIYFFFVDFFIVFLFLVAVVNRVALGTFVSRYYLCSSVVMVIVSLIYCECCYPDFVCVLACSKFCCIFYC